MLVYQRVIGFTNQQTELGEPHLSSAPKQRRLIRKIHALLRHRGDLTLHCPKHQSGKVTLK